MPDASYRWVIVAAGGLLGCVAFGALFALPVFLQAMAQETGWSRTGISSAMTIAFLAMAFGSIASGALADRFGARPVVASGTLAIIACLVLASRAASLLQFQLAFGLALGLATAAIFAPLWQAESSCASPVLLIR